MNRHAIRFGLCVIAATAVLGCGDPPTTPEELRTAAVEQLKSGDDAERMEACKQFTSDMSTPKEAVATLVDLATDPKTKNEVRIQAANALRYYSGGDRYEIGMKLANYSPDTDEDVQAALSVSAEVLMKVPESN